MKKISHLIILMMLAITCQAQSDHLKFMDIPLDCPLDTYCSKLIANHRLVAAKMREDEQYRNMQTKKLIGDFYGIKNCSFYVRKHNRLDNVSSVYVEDTLTAISKEDSKRIISLHDKKYGDHKKDSTRLSVWYTWENQCGEVEIQLNPKGFKAYYTDSTEIAVMDAILEDYKREKERQTVKEICGVPFGSSYEKTEEVLQNKYGTSSYLSDKNTIVYKNKSYAGIYFDQIMFLFQSDGYKSYLNGCVFILEATSLSDAKDKREILFKKLSLKYDMEEGVNDDGIKFYYGGHSPVPFDGFGFCIDIIKYNNRTSIPYAARLMYGRYNYVKEEF